jgi:hypothetical protein
MRDTVGFYDDAHGNVHGFLRDRRGHYTPVAEAGTLPASINDHGEIVGDYDTEPRATGDTDTIPQPSPTSPPSGPATPPAIAVPRSAAGRPRLRPKHLTPSGCRWSASVARTASSSAGR